MTTMNSSSSTSSSSLDDCRRKKLERVRQKLEQVRTRWTTVAADEFFAMEKDTMISSSSSSSSFRKSTTSRRRGSSISSSNTVSRSKMKQKEQQQFVLLPWQSLPRRVEKLANRLREQQQQQSEENQQTHYHQSRVALTAAITAAAAAAAAHGNNCCSISPLMTAFTSLFRAGLDGYFDIANNNDNENKDDNGDGGHDENANVQQEAVALYENLRFLGWLPCSSSINSNNSNNNTGSAQRRAPLLLRPLEEAVHYTILEHVRQTIGGDYETQGLLQSVQEWTRTHVETWLHGVLMGNNSINNNNNKLILQAWSERLQIMTAEAYGHTRMQEIFDVVADYPDSHTAVQDLRAVLEQSSSSSSSNSKNSSNASSSSSLLSLSNQLAETLRDSLVRRLNHPGANTTQIIDVYINTIKVLRVIDPSDRLLAVVAEPVRRYLRGRQDTVRCMIASLTDSGTCSGNHHNNTNNNTSLAAAAAGGGENSGGGASGSGGTGSGSGDLYLELRRQDAKPLENVTVDSDDEEECPDLYHWQPPPSIHKPRGTFLDSKTTGDSDILAMLVSIYGSKELFVNEYRLMLADKLLANLDYNTDKEVHTLELLKLRFGEMSMRSCEVMLKDLDDSKRSNANIKSFLEAAHNSNNNSSNNKNGDSSATESSTTTTTKNVVDAAMISHIFWPALQNEQLIHHPQLQYMLDTFGMEYARLKNPRKLIWLYQLGTVQLEIEVVEKEQIAAAGGGIDAAMTSSSTPPKIISKMKEFSCSPLLATLILHFQDKPSWTAEDLSNETGIPQHLVQKRMTYWVNNRAVKIVVPSSSPSPKKASGSGGGGGGPLYVLASVAHFGAGDNDNDGAGGGGGGGGGGTTMMEMDHILEGDGGGAFGGLGGVSVSAQEEEEMDVYVSYIVGMLTNLGQLPLKTIHNNLKTFVTGSDHKYNKTPQQLSAFLQHLCKQERLECGPDGMYKLFKK